MLNRIISLALSLALVFVLANASGCNKKWPKALGSVRIEGSVQLDGTAIENAKVVLLPFDLRDANGRLMPMAYGQSDENGEFTMKYSDGKDAIIPGKYTVLVTKPLNSSEVKSEGDQPGEEPSFQVNASPALMPAELSSLEPWGQGRDLFPAIYNRKSILVRQLEASKDVIQLDLDLTSVDPLLID